MKLSRKGAFLVAQLESACSEGDLGLILGSGRSPGEGNGTPLQYACLENSIDRGAWKTIVEGVERVGHDLVTKPPPPSSRHKSLEDGICDGRFPGNRSKKSPRLCLQ